jgi:hypothetical protein
MLDCISRLGADLEGDTLCIWDKHVEREKEIRREREVRMADRRARSWSGSEFRRRCRSRWNYPVADSPFPIGWV